MVRVVFVTEGDDQGNIWLDPATPIKLARENQPPHRIAVHSQISGAQDDKSSMYLRLTRTDAYRLIDQLQFALAEDTADGAEPVVKRTELEAPLNGGVNAETGAMILTFKGKSGLEHQFVLPFDQSGAMLEIVERAAKAAGGWHDAQLTDDLAAIQKVEIRPRETESVMVAEDPISGCTILIVRLEGGHQFSFFLDQKIVEKLIKRPTSRATSFNYPADPWHSIADDIEWFEKEWCTLYEPPSDAEIRRGSAALRRLLVEDSLGKAWRMFGFDKQPTIVGPDVVALASEQGDEIRRISSLIAGGATLNGIQAAMIGATRIDHPDTGVSADADEGFAVKTFSILRDARGDSDDNHLVQLVNTEWHLSHYLDAPGAVRTGEVISRRDIVGYFANAAGGVHLTSTQKDKEQIYGLVRELINKVAADTMDGVFFEILSIGQAIGRSNDLRKLASEIRSSTGKAR